MSTRKPASNAANVRAGVAHHRFVSPTGFKPGNGARASALATLLATLTTVARADDSPPPGYDTVVIAPRAAASVGREDAIASTSVITRDRTPRSNEDVPQLLSELPGVTVTRYGSYGSLATLSLRGSSANQVAVYADGVPLASAVVGAVDLGLMPLSPVGRIEVYRGASPLSFGTSAMGGVVSITGNAPQASGVAAHSGLGSFATRLGGGEATYVGPRLSLVASAAAFASAADFPYDSDNRTLFDASDDRRLRRQNNQLSQIDASLRASLRLSHRRQLTLAVAGVDRDQGLPARGSDESFAATLQRRRAHASLTYEGQDDLGDGGRLRALVYGLGAQQRFADPRGEIGFGPSATRDRSLTFGTTFLARRPLGTRFLIAGMLDGRREGFYPHDERRPNTRPPGSRAFAAAALSGSVYFDTAALEVQATVRGEVARDSISPMGLFVASTAVAPTTTNEFLPIARLSVLARPNDRWRVRANGGSYARLPTLSERYGNGGTIRGNPRLVPERGESADLGVAYTRTWSTDTEVAFDAAVFAARSRALIQFEEMGYFGGYANVARARTLGAELGVTGRWARHLRLSLSGTLINAIDQSDRTSSAGHRLPHQPAVRAYVRPELRDLPVGSHVTAGLYADLEASGGRYADPANLVRQPGRRVFGAGASLAYRPAHLRAVLSAYNLGDQRAADVLEYPLPGRSFFVTLEFAYSKEELRP